jgi:response regulator RpfG family c-di-GMP phosphodiesterase
MTKKVILCVDDEKFILDSLKTQLKERFGEKYAYEMADNADDAWELIEELKAEGMDILIIVSDWLMPGIKGDEFLIDVHKKFPHIVKVLLTGHADEHSIERARKYADLHRCLFKPWTEEELVDTINTGLAKL